MDELMTPRSSRRVRVWVAGATLLSCALCSSVPAQEAADTSVMRSARPAYEARRPAGIEIRVVDRGWGNARRPDIEAVLYSVAGVLLEHFPGRRLNPIEVSHAPERPM